MVDNSQKCLTAVRSIRVAYKAISQIRAPSEIETIGRLLARFDRCRADILEMYGRHVQDANPASIAALVAELNLRADDLEIAAIKLAAGLDRHS